MTSSKAMLEKELQEVITLTSTELEEYQEKVLELEDEVGSLVFYVCDALHTGVIIDYLHFFHSFKSPDASKSESES